MPKYFLNTVLKYLAFSKPARVKITFISIPTPKTIR